jgi:hypothetical protein
MSAATPMALDPHTATALVWRALVAALNPLRLRDVPRLLGNIVRRVRAYDPNAHKPALRRLDAFRAKHADAWTAAA